MPTSTSRLGVKPMALQVVPIGRAHGQMRGKLLNKKVKPSRLGVELTRKGQKMSRVYRSTLREEERELPAHAAAP